jgi:hypothetical protein
MSKFGVEKIVYEAMREWFRMARLLREKFTIKVGYHHS